MPVDIVSRRALPVALVGLALAAVLGVTTLATRESREDRGRDRVPARAEPPAAPLSSSPAGSPGSSPVAAPAPAAAPAPVTDTEDAPSGAPRVGRGVPEPRKLKHVNPVYPEVARQARVEGVVILECTVGAQGTVTGVQVVQGVPLLDDAAIAAVKQWRYTPTLVQGQGVPVTVTVTLNFRLR